MGVLLLVAALMQDAPRAREIDAWIEQLGDNDPAVREAAECGLAGLGRDLVYAIAASAGDTRRKLLDAVAAMSKLPRSSDESPDDTESFSGFETNDDPEGERGYRTFIRRCVELRRQLEHEQLDEYETLIIMARPRRDAPRLKEIDAWVSESATTRVLELAGDLRYAIDALWIALTSSEPETAGRAERVIREFRRNAALTGQSSDELLIRHVRRREARRGHALWAELPGMIERLERRNRGGEPEAEEDYQDFLAHYASFRRVWAGDPVRLNELDGMKARAEQVHGGSERLTKRARALLAADPANLHRVKALRTRTEFFQDERIIEMDRMIREGERRLAELKKR